jgi:hypothetical protein
VARCALYNTVTCTNLADLLVLLTYCPQIVVEWDDAELPLVLEALERCDAHLTAAIVTKDIQFQNKVCPTP